MISPVSPKHLQCEYLQDPVGIDVPQPRLGWELESAQPNQIQTAFQILVADQLNLLETNSANVWDSGKVETAQSSQVVYGGPDLQSTTTYWWKVRVWDSEGRVSDYSSSASWQMGQLRSGDWQARWIGLDVQPTHDPVMRPPVYTRHTFSIEAPASRAILYATARGCYKALVNGQQAGRDALTPGWTDYNKRIQYQTYDVTHLLDSGDNVLAAIVADGWYAGYVGQNLMRNHYGDTPQLLLQLHIEHEDGSTTVVATGDNWRGAAGPIGYSDLQMGEYYDARLEIPGWAAPGFDDSQWQLMQIYGADHDLLVAQPNQTMRVTEQIKPVGITHPADGNVIFDMGQNMVGWIRLTVSGSAGTVVTLRHGEMLNPDGTLYTENLRDARQTDTYILKGGGVESYEPGFTFHGFRYVEVTGLQDAVLETVTGHVIHNDMPSAGSFACSNSMVNQLWQNILWGQRGNFVSVPTDCPQRNERLGWTGDAQVFIRTASFNMDVAAFFSKWMLDMVDAQSEAGGFPNFAPRIAMDLQVAPGTADWDGAPAWGDAGVIIPWTIYEVYGDTRIIERHYAAMDRWMTYIEEVNPQYLRQNRCNQNFADWLALGAETPRTLVATAYWYYCADLMARMATAVGHQGDAQRFARLGENIRAAFIREYVSDDGHLAGDTQTGYALALNFGLMPEDLRANAAQYLVDAIERNDNHIATGFLGTPLLCPVLTEIGRPSTAYQLLLNDTYPSWGYMIKQGATTMWERWDGWTEAQGFQDPDMNSFNHYAYGAIGEWMYRYVAGIDLDRATPDYHGYKRILIRPTIDERLSFARATYHSIHGAISSHWWIEGDQLHLEIVIPANTTARVIVPAVDAKLAGDSDSLSQPVPGSVSTSTFHVGAGKHHFMGTRAS
jgi:alpha-L-rhamnosidase